MLFAIPRAAGYLAHWRESLTDPDVKIMRPQQIYEAGWCQVAVKLQLTLSTLKGSRVVQNWVSKPILNPY